MQHLVAVALDFVEQRAGQCDLRTQRALGAAFRCRDRRFGGHERFARAGRLELQQFGEGRAVAAVQQIGRGHVVTLQFVDRQIDAAVACVVAEILHELREHQRAAGVRGPRLRIRRVWRTCARDQRREGAADLCDIALQVREIEVACLFEIHPVTVDERAQCIGLGGDRRMMLRERLRDRVRRLPVGQCREFLVPPRELRVSDGRVAGFLDGFLEFAA